MAQWEYCYIRTIYGSFSRKATRIEVVYLKEHGTRTLREPADLETKVSELIADGWTAVPHKDGSPRLNGNGMTVRAPDLKYFKRLVVPETASPATPA
ncbi:MAG: hypothetical protein ACYC6L_16955 [Anaerolineae bacterium]